VIYLLTLHHTFFLNCCDVTKFRNHLHLSVERQYVNKCTDAHHGQDADRYTGDIMNRCFSLQGDVTWASSWIHDYFRQSSALPASPERIRSYWRALRKKRPTTRWRDWKVFWDLFCDPPCTLPSGIKWWEHEVTMYGTVPSLIVLVWCLDTRIICMILRCSDIF
jgi:hypothetical protein